MARIGEQEMPPGISVQSNQLRTGAGKGDRERGRGGEGERERGREREIERESTITYSAAISACEKAGKWVRALQLL